VTVYLLNCGDWRLEGTETSIRVDGENNPDSSSSGNNDGGSLVESDSESVNRPGSGSIRRSLQSPPDPDSMTPRRLNVLVRAKYSSATLEGNHLGTGQEPLVQSYIVLLILNFAVLLLSAAAGAR